MPDPVTKTRRLPVTFHEVATETAQILAQLKQSILELAEERDRAANWWETVAPSLHCSTDIHSTCVEEARKARATAQRFRDMIVQAEQLNSGQS